MAAVTLACRASSFSFAHLQRRELYDALPQIPRARVSSIKRQYNGGRRGFHGGMPLASRPKMSFRLAVSSSGKGRRFSPDRNFYNFHPQVHDAIGIQSPNYYDRKAKRPDSGEDAFFISKIGYDDNAFAFGVADGVGGWSESGIDPADFSHSFCGHMAETSLNWESSPESLRAMTLMRLGYEKTLLDKAVFAGSSTACIGVARDDGSVQLANLGDSGSLLFRLAAVHHYSVPQTHDFNTPYQLAVVPELIRRQSYLFGGKQFEDMPQDAAITNCSLQHGDVLVLATDGVFDNLNNQEVLKLVTARMMATGAWTGTSDMGISAADSLDALTKPGGLTFGSKRIKPAKTAPTSEEEDPQGKGQTLQALLAVTIAGEAKIASMDFRRDGPFAKEYQRHRPWDHYRGGKPDDITVVVLVAVEEGRSTATAR
ncbi:azr1 protein [Microsporum canis CBS 113480]|uniref:Protein phosphatase n=1 Tax=Arthroderma otae (strain ATCC MYA-4605 / CBS 113480) TaxID=554155 RepID=C5FX03_ARTOC|nr:azr1 protein [Microsporum canis CBS 113480]EEQ34843.1 azr1 protein [Microsporum canis CBS 113480]